MKRLRHLLGDSRGASAAEFALVLPLLLILLFGSIDIGRYAWALSMAEKATQVGARWAVTTDMIPSGLITYSFATGSGVPQGTTVNAATFPGVECDSSGCRCKSGGTCNFPLTASSAAFNRLAARMAQINPDIGPENVVVTYSWSGLGFSGDPNGPDVAPLTTVSLRNLEFAPFTAFVFGGTVDMPGFAYTLPMEDGSGTSSN
ncbi:MAG: pilus assembly protein [Sphingomonadales bacterium]|nr:pilus assembly protein [Sphingomonadaceae bacterium]MBS3929651.1 pilus assembly protein [Sphingomonadales bacterium]